MREVKLLNRDLEYVATATILPFITMPKILTWGVRTFERRNDETYVECFTGSVLSTRTDPQDATCWCPEGYRINGWPHPSCALHAVPELAARR
jgi:hypothetical protein